MVGPAIMNSTSRMSNFLFMLFLFSVSFRRLPGPARLVAPQAPRLLFLIDPSSTLLLRVLHALSSRAFSSSSQSAARKPPLYLFACPHPCPHSHSRHFHALGRHSVTP